MTPTTRTVYLVQRIALKQGRYAEGPSFYPSTGEEGSSQVPVRAYATHTEAEAVCETLEREARESTPPIRFIVYSLPVPASKVMAAIRDLGFPAPDLGPDSNQYQYAISKQQIADLRRWWSQHGPELTPEMHSLL